MRKLVVSADDLGIARSVNEGIVKAATEGIVTNVTLMPTGEAYEEGVKLAREGGLTEAGAHLALTETAPVSVRNRIPTLVTRKGAFRRGRAAFVRDLLLRRIDLDQVYIELRSQLALASRSGLRITSLSCHEHLHMLPALLEIFVKLAIEYDVPFVRCPRPEKLLTSMTVTVWYKNLVLSAFGPKTARMLRDAGLRFTDHFAGLVESGGMTEDRLVARVASAEEGTTELVTHPGYLGPAVVDTYRFHLNCEEELAGLTGKRVRQALADRGVTLTSFGALAEAA